MKKFALVLSGGGFKGAFQIGALRQLKKHWSVIDPESSAMGFDVVAGVSVGSLNGVLTASGEFDALEKLWLDIGSDVENIYTSDFIDTKNQTDKLKVHFDFRKIRQRFIPNVDLRIPLWRGLRMLFSRSKREEFLNELLQKVEADFSANFNDFRAIADNTPLKTRLDALISINKVRGTFKCGFVSLNNGKYYACRQSAFKTDEDFRKGILASTSMPIVWAPVDTIRFVHHELETISQSVDGGIRNVSPLADVIDEINKDDPGHEYTIFIINCNAGEVAYEDFKNANIAGIAMRSLNDIAITEIFNNDLTEFLRINDIIGQVRSVNPSLEILNYNVREGRTSKILRPFKAIIIQPDAGILGDTLVANQTLNSRRIKHGEDKATAALSVYQERKGPDLVIV